MRAAQLNHLPPTLFWGRHRDFPGRWTAKDLTLAEAFVIYEAGLCRGCGQPAGLAYDDFNSGEFEVKDDSFCLACEQLEQHVDEKLAEGQKRYVVAHFDEVDDNQ